MNQKTAKLLHVVHANFLHRNGFTRRRWKRWWKQMAPKQRAAARVDLLDDLIRATEARGLIKTKKA